jgi:hypothetical protein
MPARLQFTIARLLACTALVALAAWVAMHELPIEVHVPSESKLNLLPYILSGLLVASAVGVLFSGRPGARKGIKVGCAIFVALAAVVPTCFSLRELFSWLVRDVAGAS